MPSQDQTAFIAYSRRDSEFALKLAGDLKAAGARVWIDQLDIQPGSRWDRAIEDALTRSSTFLVILSPDSAESRNFHDEVSFALEKHKHVIPIFWRDCKIPLGLRRLQYVDFTKDYQQGLAGLLTAIAVEPGPKAEQERRAAEEKARLEERQRQVTEKARLEEERRLALQRTKQEEERRAAEQQKLKEAQEVVEAKAAGWDALVNGPTSDVVRQSVTFICYSHEDVAFARKLAQDLRNKGARVWMDKLDIRAGQPYRKKIDEALRSCDRMVVIVSPASVESDEVTSEYTSFLKRRKTVIPVLYKECEMPYRLDTFEYADFFSREYEEAMEELLLSLMED